MPRVNSVKCKVCMTYKSQNLNTPFAREDLKKNKLKNKINFAFDIQTFLLRHFTESFIDLRRFSIFESLLDCIREHVRYKLQDPSVIVKNIDIYKFMDNARAHINRDVIVAHMDNNTVHPIKYNDLPKPIQELYHLFRDILYLRYNLQCILPMPKEKITPRDDVDIDYMDYFLNLSLVPKEILDSIEELVKDCKNTGKGFEKRTTGHMPDTRHVFVSPYIHLYFYDLNIYPNAKRKPSLIGDLYCSTQQRFEEFKLIGAVS